MGVGDIKWFPKKFFVLFLPLFHKLKTIQEKIKSKRFISAVAKALTLYLTENKGCCQFGQPNLFILTVRDRLPGVGWANSSVQGIRGQAGGLECRLRATASTSALST